MLFTSGDENAIVRSEHSLDQVTKKDIPDFLLDVSVHQGRDYKMRKSVQENNYEQFLRNK